MIPKSKANVQPILSFISIIILLLMTISCSKDDGSSEEFAYISNQKGNVLVMSLDGFSLIKEIEVGAGNRGLGITDDGQMLAVAVKSSGDLALIDLKTLKIVKRVSIGKNPEFVRVRDYKAYVSFEPAAIGGPPPKPGSKEAKKLQSQREEDGEELARVAVVDLIKMEKIAEIEGGMETEGIEFSFDNSKIVVTNEADENISVHDIDSGTLFKKIDTKELGNRPRGIKRSPTEPYYLATLEYGNRLLKISKDFEIIKDVPTGEVPYGIAFSADGKEAFVALSRGKTIQVFDTTTLEPIKEIPIGNRCWHFSFTPDEEHIITACGRSNEILIIKASSGKVVKTYSDQKMPWGIVTYPKSMGTLDAPLRKNIK